MEDLETACAQYLLVAKSRSLGLRVNLNAFGLTSWLYSAVAPKKGATWFDGQKKTDATQVAFLGAAERLVVRARLWRLGWGAARLAGFFRMRFPGPSTRSSRRPHHK